MQPPQVTCPACGSPVAWEPASRWRPFCSRRCRLIDLGDWLTERHRIAGDDATEGENGTNEPPDDDLRY